jgi:hypothetical protein
MTRYNGGCHCGKVRYEVDIDLNQTIQCNCSICSKKGYVLSFAGEKQFKLLQGESDLATYKFNTMKINHMFCKNCGTSTFGRGQDKSGNPTFAINVRTLDDVDVSKLNPAPYDGKNA